MMDDRINDAPCGFFSLNSAGKIEEANQAFSDIVGFSPADLAGQYIETLLTTASKMMFHSLFLPQIQKDGLVEQMNLTFLKKDGGEIPVLLMGKKANCTEAEVIDCVVMRVAKGNHCEKQLQNMEQELEKAYVSKKHWSKLFETALSSVKEAIIVTDNLGKITIMNTLAESYTGWGVNAAVGKAFGEVFDMIDRKTQKKLDIFQHVTTQNNLESVLDDLILVPQGGKSRYITGTVTFMISPDQSASGLVIALRDITKEYSQEQEIDAFLQMHTEIFCVLTADGIFHRMNHKFEEEFGYTAIELYGQNYFDFVKEKTTAKEAILLLTEDGEDSCFTNWFRCSNGSYKYIEWNRKFAAGEFLFFSARDITEKQQQEENLFNIAVRDQLTGLYNRHYLDAYLEQQVKESEEYDRPLSLAILDLDHFQRVNDNWGRPVGDELLKMIAHVVNSAIRSADLLVRFHGEKFVIIMPQTDGYRAIMALDNVRIAVETSRHPIVGKQTVSIGVAERKYKESFLKWYERADGALYLAKQQGRNRIASAVDEA